MRNSGLRDRTVIRVNGATREAAPDALAIEEPLEIRIAGDPVAVTMRTPGNDRELALGFLHSEGIVRSADDVGALAHCGRPGDEGYGNVLEVTAAPGLVLDFEKVRASRRGTLTTSACGVCGRRSVDDLVGLCGDVGAESLRVSSALIASAPERLREAQENFSRTGGVHAAAAFTASGERLCAFEDVGRHNAVDKVVGKLLLLGLLGEGTAPSDARRPALLCVSGRASFEILQKATVARIPIVASVSAASSLAVELAERSGITLATFVRDGRFTLCAHPSRVL